MIILFLVFLIQFFVAVACLAINEPQVKDLVEKGWNRTSEDVQHRAMQDFDCCPNGLLSMPDCQKVAAILNLKCEGSLLLYRVFFLI